MIKKILKSALKRQDLILGIGIGFIAGLFLAVIGYR
mgnify:CR=1 FL=1